MQMDYDVAYYEFYDCEIVDGVYYYDDTGHRQQCVYYLYWPKDGIDEETPVVAYVTHGGGVAEEERANTLSWAAGQETEAIFVVPYTDMPDAVCASIDHARKRLDGKGDFQAVSGHGTSSGGRAILQAALESVNPDAAYGFRFANVFAYDPAHETETTNITGQTEAMRALAEQGTVFFIQTDGPLQNNGSRTFCNRYARVYADAGGAAIVAEIGSASHEGKYMLPLTHNSINWAIGKGRLIEDEEYKNAWYKYEGGVKYPCTLEEAALLLHPDGAELQPRRRVLSIKEVTFSPGKS